MFLKLVLHFGFKIWIKFGPDRKFIYVYIYIYRSKIDKIFAVATLSFTRSGDHQATDRLFNYSHIYKFTDGVVLHINYLHLNMGYILLVYQNHIHPYMHYWLLNIFY